VYRGHALELARVDDARAAHRVFVSDSALANVGHDLGIAARLLRDRRARWETILVEKLERSEAAGDRIRSVARVKRPPDIPLMAANVTSRFGPTDADHRELLLVSPSMAQQVSGRCSIAE
jgi:hypothetical protein